MKFKMTFDPELKKTIEVILKNESERFDDKYDRARSVKKIRRFALRKKATAELKPLFMYDVYDDHADIEIVTGFDMFCNEKRILKAFQKYDSISNGKITTELVKDE